METSLRVNPFARFRLRFRTRSNQFCPCLIHASVNAACLMLDPSIPFSLNEYVQWTRAVRGLNHRRIRSRTALRLEVLQRPLPLPRGALVVRQVSPSRGAAPLFVSLHTRTQWPFSNAIHSTLAPGFGMSMCVTGPHVTPASFDSAIRTCLGNPLSRIIATTVPSFFRTNDGWMLPISCVRIGSLKVHVFPQSSVNARKRAIEHVRVQAEHHPVVRRQ